MQKNTKQASALPGDFKKMNPKKNNIIDNDEFRIAASIVESHGRNDDRDSEFKKLYKEAQGGDSIKILGLGVTSFLNGDDIDELLQKGVNITVLLMHDKIIKDGDCSIQKKMVSKESSQDDNDVCPVSIRNVLIDKNHFSDYQSRKRSDTYISKMHQAYKNCSNYKEEYPNIFNYCCFNSFVPMSLTSFQKNEESGEGRLIVEFIIPFTKNRILLKVFENENKRIYDTFMNFYNIMETESKKSQDTRGDGQEDDNNMKVQSKKSYKKIKPDY